MTYKVFVYGSLKRDYSNHSVLSGAKFITEAKTTGSAWHMFSMGGFPGIVGGLHNISGEIYEVDEAGLKRLDWLEGNGAFYNREVIETDQGLAWMYVLMDASDRDINNNYGVRNENGVFTWLK